MTQYLSPEDNFTGYRPNEKDDKAYALSLPAVSTPNLSAKAFGQEELTIAKAKEMYPDGLDPAEFHKIEDQRQVARNVVERFTAYATGSAVGIVDRAEVEAIGVAPGQARQGHAGLATLEASEASVGLLHGEDDLGRAAHRGARG